MIIYLLDKIILNKNKNNLINFYKKFKILEIIIIV